MSISTTSPIAGLAQTGLTNPTYTVITDSAPPGNPGKQVAVSALGGTQTGVQIHSVACPFTLNFTRPATLRVVGQPNPVTGILSPSSIPRNTYKLITRKGVIPLAGQANAVMVITTTVDVPAGADTADPLSIKAALSAHGGLLSQQASGFGDMLINGVL